MENQSGDISPKWRASSVALRTPPVRPRRRNHAIYFSHWGPVRDKITTMSWGRTCPLQGAPLPPYSMMSEGWSYQEINKRPFPQRSWGHNLLQHWIRGGALAVEIKNSRMVVIFYRTGMGNVNLKNLGLAPAWGSPCAWVRNLTQDCVYQDVHMWLKRPCVSIPVAHTAWALVFIALIWF